MMGIMWQTLLLCCCAILSIDCILGQGVCNPPKTYYEPRKGCRPCANLCEYRLDLSECYYYCSGYFEGSEKDNPGAILPSSSTVADIMTPSDAKTILLDFTQDMSGAEPRPEIVTDISENRNVSPAPVDSLYRHKLAFVAAIPVLVAITLLCIVGICYCQSTLSATPTSATSDYSELTVILPDLNSKCSANGDDGDAAHKEDGIGDHYF